MQYTMQKHIQIKLMKIMHFFNNMIISLSLLLSLLASFSNAQTNSTTFQVGVILDADSLVGCIGLTSLSLSLSDFYTLNANYSTRIALHIRDSRSQITGAVASAVDLLKEVRVDAIIGPQKSTQAHFVISLGDAAKVPVVSFSATSPSLHPQYSYFVQTAPSDAAQVDAIAALVKHSQWYQVVLVYEDSYCNKHKRVGSLERTEGYAFVFPKGSPLVSDVSRAIVELTDNRRISAIKRQWFGGLACGEEPDRSDVRISLKSFKVLFGITGGITATCLVLFLASYLYQNRDFVQRISSSGTTAWSKLRAMCKHFDQRDPKSFRSGRPLEDCDQIASPTTTRWSTVVPFPSHETPSDSPVVGPN